MEVNLFVIIVTYKGQQWYDRCFTSLRESTIPVQIVVVDNASNDGTVEYIRENYPEIHLIESKENLGFGRANNLGMRYALDNGCDYVFLLNQDAWVEKDTFEILVQCHQNQPSFGVISPMHLTALGDHTNFLMYDNKHNGELLSDLYCGSLKEIYHISYVNAAAWLLPRFTLEKIGGFCPLIFHYGEDDDYLNRLHYHEIDVGLCPKTRIYHDTRNRLGESERFFQKANAEKIDEYLNITKDINFSKLCRFYLRKAFLCLLKGNKRLSDDYFKQYKFVRKHRKEIESCRASHKVLQSNWL